MAKRDEGFPMEEADDIYTERWNLQITDEQPDVVRRRGSVHGGAAYMQNITYPPHGASGGQSGGSMRPEETIEIFGSAYTRGLDVLGVGPLPKLQPKRAGFVIAKTPGGIKHSTLRLNPSKTGDYKSSVANARDAGKRAIRIGNALKALAQKAKRTATKVHGDDDDIVGAMTAKQREALKKYLKKLLGGATINGEYDDEMFDDGDDFVGMTTRQRKALKKSLANATINGEYDDEMFDEDDDIVGMTERQRAALKKYLKKLLGGATINGDYGEYGGPGNEALGVVRTPAPIKHSAMMKRPRFTPAQMLKIADRAIKSGNAAIAQAKKYEAMAHAQEAKKISGIKALQAKLGKNLAIKALAGLTASSTAAAPGRARAAVAARPGAAAAQSVPQSRVAQLVTMMKGDYDAVHDICGAHCDVLGDDMLDDMIGQTPDPSNPGFMTDGSLDPAYDWSSEDQGTTSADDRTSLQMLDPGPMPTAETLPPFTAYTPDPYPGHPWDDPSVYAAVPYGALPFDGVPALDGSSEASIGSANRFLSNGPEGKKYGQDSGFQFDEEGWRTYDARDQQLQGRGAHYSNISRDDEKDLNVASASYGWGPIIGRPNSDFSGLRFSKYDSSKEGSVAGAMTLFWFYDQAPARLKGPLELARLSQALTDWNTKKTIYDTEVANRALLDQQHKAEAEESARQQALADAATARRQEQEQKEQEHQAQLQAVADQQATEAAAAEAASAEEVATTAGERQAQLEEERGQRMAEAEAAMQERQAESDLAYAQRVAEAAAQYEDTAPAEGEAPTEDEVDTGLEVAPVEDESMHLNESYNEPDDDTQMEMEMDTLLGMLQGATRHRAIDRLHARREARR